MRPDDRQGIPVIECWEDVNSTALVDDDTQSAKQGKTFTMKPTPTPEMIEALEVARDQIIAMYRTWVVDDATAMPTEISLAGRAIAKIDAALSVPAEAVVGEPVGDIAYNAGLEIRHAIAASGVDPIQHIPEVDAIIERLLAEARKAAFIEAAEIAETLGVYPELNVFAGGPEWYKHGKAIAKVIRAKAKGRP